MAAGRGSAAVPAPAVGPERRRSPSDRADLGRGRLGAGDRRAAGARDRRQGARPGVAYLRQEFAKTSGNDHETRAALLHALSTRHAAGFEAANSINRMRDGLSDPALAYLALTFANLDRVTLANELIGILAARAKTEATAPGRPARVYWNNSGRSQAIRGRHRNDGTGRAGLCAGPAAGARARRGRRLASGSPRRRSAGNRTRPRGRRSPRWRRTTAGHRGPKIATS